MTNALRACSSAKRGYLEVVHSRTGAERKKRSKKIDQNGRKRGGREGEERNKGRITLRAACQRGRREAGTLLERIGREGKTRTSTWLVIETRNAYKKSRTASICRDEETTVSFRPPPRFPLPYFFFLSSPCSLFSF